MIFFKKPWYRDGLQFSCTSCGRCCKGPNPGHVWINREEIEALAKSLDMTIDNFERRYLHWIGDRYSLVEKANNDCIFWEDEQGCTVYELRPGQCRQFPFWPEILERRKDWRREAKSCPGMDQGRHYSQVEIEAIRNGRADTRTSLEEIDMLGTREDSKPDAQAPGILEV